MSGDLEFLLADQAGDLFGNRGLETLLDLNDLPGMAEGGYIRFGFFDIFQADIALGQLAHDDFSQGANFELVLGGKFYLIFFEDDFSGAAFEIETVGQLFFCLVDGILDFHRVYLRNNIERRHEQSLKGEAGGGNKNPKSRTPNIRAHRKGFLADACFGN